MCVQSLSSPRQKKWDGPMTWDGGHDLWEPNHCHGLIVSPNISSITARMKYCHRSTPQPQQRENLLWISKYHVELGTDGFKPSPFPSPDRWTALRVSAASDWWLRERRSSRVGQCSPEHSTQRHQRLQAGTRRTTSRKIWAVQQRNGVTRGLHRCRRRFSRAGIRSMGDF